MIQNLDGETSCLSIRRDRFRGTVLDAWICLVHADFLHIVQFLAVAADTVLNNRRIQFHDEHATIETPAFLLFQGRKAP